MWGIIPAAGKGSRIQPLAFSKELLPVGIRSPRAVSDYLVERMSAGGATRICFVISQGKSDIMEYYGGSAYSSEICYAVQPRPAGLCDAIFRALPFIDARAPVLVGLPDTIWYPEDGFLSLPADRFSFLLFPVDRPEFFDAVVTDDVGRILKIQVKQQSAESNWVWGAFKMPGAILRELFELWNARGRSDEYIGALVNEWMARGNTAWGVRAGISYYDVGTMDGYWQTMRMLAGSGAA